MQEVFNEYDTVFTRKTTANLLTETGGPVNGEIQISAQTHANWDQGTGVLLICFDSFEMFRPDTDPSSGYRRSRSIAPNAPRREEILCRIHDREKMLRFVIQKADAYKNWLKGWAEASWPFRLTDLEP